MTKYGYNFTFEEVSYLLETLSNDNSPESCKIKSSLLSQMNNWKRWDDDLQRISNAEKPHVFTGI
jgi:hypothetical protein